jgi:nucleotide-binding universal stress UspA family protein
MQRFKNILCVVVPGSEGGVALERAATLAGNNQAYLTVVEVIDKIPSNTRLPDSFLSPDELQTKIVAQRRQVLEELVASSNRNIKINTKVFIGTSFLEIIREVLRNEHDLVIKTTESGGLLDRVFGSDDMHLLRKCPVPVWLVKSDSPSAYQRILAAVDVNDSYPPEELKTSHLLNLQILEMASSLALSEFAELHVVNAWHAIGESTMRGAFMTKPEHEIIAYIEGVRQHNKQNLNVLMDEIIGKLGKNSLEYLKPQAHLLQGWPRNKIPELAGEIKADLVVMGTVARTGIPGFFMGNTAETILNRLDCSVLAIKPPGFETPVTLDD